MRRVVSGTYERPDLGKLEVVHADEELSLGILGYYLVGVWRGEISMRSAITWSRGLAQLSAAHPDKKVAVLSVIERTCPGPAAPPVVACFTDGMARVREHLAANAVVYPTEGFAGAVVRSQLVAVNNDSKAGAAYMYSLTLEPAAAWLAKTMNDTAPLRVASLCNAVEQLQLSQVAFSVGS